MSTERLYEYTAVCSRKEALSLTRLRECMTSCSHFLLHRSTTQAKTTEVMHSAPRFSHTDDFSALFTSTAAAEDYMRGLVFAGAFILAIGIAWYVYRVDLVLWTCDLVQPCMNGVDVMLVVTCKS